jgi:nucleoside-diphosphate-sugar epimerase
MQNRIQDVEDLEERLSAPSERLLETFQRVRGDILVLGAAGKMGPTLARMAKRASLLSHTPRRVIAVSRFSEAGSAESLQRHGIETIPCDLLEGDLEALPSAPNVIFMAGRKFGSQGNEALTWAMNVWLPGRVAQRFAGSRIVAFSTGNVYGLSPVQGGGSREDDTPNPQGEYAMSCLGRERIFEHFSRVQETPMAIIRLNYAVEMRYGVLVDIARRVWEGEEVDLSMGYVNVIWQGEANALSLCALEVVASPPTLLNVAGSEILRIRKVAEEFGERMGRSVRFVGQEREDALLNCGQKARDLFGAQETSVSQMMDWITDWITRGGASLNKPTHFEVRDGKF